MQSVELDDKEWQQVVAVLANGPWNVVNPILTKLAAQLQVNKVPNGPDIPKAKVKVAESKTEGRA